MCKKCDEIDKKIEKLEKLFSPALDPFTQGIMRSSIDALKAEKAAVQCEDHLRDGE